MNDDDDRNTIHGYWAKTSWVGSCNACQRRDDDRVAELHLRTTSHRLCKDCAESMRDVLEALIGEEADDDTN